ncbi:hypothetical protein K2X89_11045 [Myxococcota bacterium]|nr:hypothetical protein [Myxococcota bacterium]
MKTRFLFRFLVLALVAVLSAGNAYADVPECAPIAVAINPSDTQTADCINLLDRTITTNTTLATCHAGEDDFIAPIPLVFTSIRARVDVAPGTTGGTDIRTVALVWDPPGATAATASGNVACSITGTGTTCTSPSGNKQTIPAGSTVSIRHTAVSSPSAPDAAAELLVSVCTGERGFNP